MPQVSQLVSETFPCSKKVEVEHPEDLQDHFSMPNSPPWSLFIASFHSQAVKNALGLSLVITKHCCIIVSIPNTWNFSKDHILVHYSVKIRVCVLLC